MALDIIASEDNLYHHHVPINPRCALCGFYKANTKHALFFFFCQTSKRSWKSTEWWNILKKMEEQNTVDIIFTIGKCLSKMEFERFRVRSWGVWKDRCKIIHNPKDGSDWTLSHTFGI